VISPMNWGGRTRTYNFLINSPVHAGTARGPLPTVRGKLAPAAYHTGAALDHRYPTSPRTNPRTAWSLS
jgi:hypothetical protein